MSPAFQMLDFQNLDIDRLTKFTKDDYDSLVQKERNGWTPAMNDVYRELLISAERRIIIQSHWMGEYVPTGSLQSVQSFSPSLQILCNKKKI